MTDTIAQQVMKRCPEPIDAWHCVVDMKCHEHKTVAAPDKYIYEFSDGSILIFDWDKCEVTIA